MAYMAFFVVVADGVLFAYVCPHMPTLADGVPRARLSTDVHARAEEGNPFLSMTSLAIRQALRKGGVKYERSASQDELALLAYERLGPHWCST